MRVSEAVRNNAVDGADTVINTGAGTAVLQIRTGAPPTNLTDAAAGTLLASFDLDNPALEAAAAGEADASGLPLSTTWAATGTVGHFRVVNRNGDAVVDSGSVSNGNEVQGIDFGGGISSGTFTVGFDGQTTAAVDASATFQDMADDLQAALEALSNIGAGNVLVTLVGSTLRVEFVGDLAQTDVATMTIESDTTGEGLSVYASEALPPGGSATMDGGVANHHAAGIEMVVSTLDAVSGNTVEVTAFVVEQPAS